MLAISIKDIKSFMSKLLVKDTFDSLLTIEAVITTGNTFTIDGSVNKTFYSEEEYEALENKQFSSWKQLKPFIFELIKGSKVPTALRIVFSLPETICKQLIDEADDSITIDDVNGLYINIRFQDGLLKLSTASSLKVFTLNKDLDNCFEKYVRLFLENTGIEYLE